MITELVFSGIFGKLNEKEVCALLSIFVCDESGKDDKQSKVTDAKLNSACSEVLEHARRVHRVLVESKIVVDEVN